MLNIGSYLNEDVMCLVVFLFNKCPRSLLMNEVDDCVTSRRAITRLVE